MTDTTSPPHGPSPGETGAGHTAVDLAAAAREALDGRRWDEAFEAFAAADAAGPLSGRDLEAYALAAFFSAHGDVERELKERGFRAYQDEGDELRAAYLALDVAREYGYQGKHAIASAWTRRAEAILGEDGDTYAHGYLALIRSEAAAAKGDIDAALAHAERAIDLGTRAADADLRAFALSNLGALKIATGSTTDGVALMEEASIAAVNGELSPFTTGVTACRMISACRDLTDYRRASEWIEATERYCHRESLSGFPGVCRIHRAEVAAVEGAWERAEEDLVRATSELERFQATPPQADGFYAIGDVRRLRGDLEGAEAALREAHMRGRSPQPALALIRLAEGRVKAAASAINAAVDEQSWDRWARARLLPAQVEIAIAAGDIDRARTALEGLTEVIGLYPSPATKAATRVATGRVLLAEGDAAGAVRELRAGIRDWRDVGAPHEVARARALLSTALRAVDDEDDADLELQAAIDAFRQLGARIDLEAAERTQRDVAERRHGPQTAHRTFMFTDIVGSTTLAEAMGDQAWERLLRWHDDLIRDHARRGGGEVVNSTGDGFFIAFMEARPAVECARAIQRALLEHRDAAGFALSVRIGLHTADANRRGDDYSGKGVHVAARVGALAHAGEILVSADTLAEAGEVPGATLREVTVRGVSTPVAVASVPVEGSAQTGPTGPT